MHELQLQLPVRIVMLAPAITNFCQATIMMLSLHLVFMHFMLPVIFGVVVMSTLPQCVVEQTFDGRQVALAFP